MKIKSLFLTVIVILLASVPGRTQHEALGTERIALLQQAQADCAWKIRTLTGGPKGTMLLHQKTMENVLEKLKAGQPVDSKAIAAVLKEHRS